ncbi:MAG TPA: hypothetical protein VK589_13165, partial [Chryseolinea sp.]|nr:hypothetical protein [Chryseolinea sp.]
MLKRNHFIGLFIALSYACQPGEDKLRTWSIYKADSESSSYSPLSAVNKDNVNQLKEAWTFHPNDARGTRFGNSECNPIIIDNVMYATSARHRLYAIEASTGQLKWSFDPFN